MLMEHQTTKPEGILKQLHLYQETAWINCKTKVSTKRWNSRVEFHGQNDQPRKKLDNLKIYLNFSWTEFYEIFDDKPSQSLSVTRA